jgi:U1 small nuclear ribonucleoprotein
VKRKPPPYSGVAKYLGLFETTAPPARIVHETPRDKREKRKKLKQEEHQRSLEEEIKRWDPHKPSSAVAAVTTKDAYKTLFVARLSYDTTEETLRREFEAYGPVSRIRVVHKRGKDDILTGSDEGDQPRGYAFVEFAKEEDMRARGVLKCCGAFNSCPSHDAVGRFFSDFEAVRTVSSEYDAPRRRQAYKRADGRKVDGRRLLVDVERGRTVAKWRPRRLGGGLGATRRSGGPPRAAARPVSRPQQSYGARPSYGSGPPRRYRSRSRDRGYDRRR